MSETNTQLGPNKDYTHVVPEDLEQSLMEWGDRQRPEESNQGYAIERLESEPLSEPVPAEEVLPIAFAKRYGLEEVNRIRHDDMLERMMSDQVPIKQVESTILDRTYGLKLRLDYTIDRTAYQEAVATGKVQPDAFGEKNKVNALDAKASGLNELIEEDQRREVIDTELTKSSANLAGSYRNEFGVMDDINRGKITGILEAFDLSDSDQLIRLLNFSSTHISDEHLRQAVNVLRSFADKSGGGVFDNVHSIAILPEDHPLLKTTFKREDGQTGTALRGGYFYFGLIVISDRLIKKSEDRAPKPALGRERTPFERFGLPGEPAEGPGSPKSGIGGEDFEATLAHEFEHGALPEKYQKANQLPGPAPTMYGRTSPEEHRAELGAAAYMGGKDALDVPADQRAVMEDMWSNYRGTPDGGSHYNQPLGPHFITCKELSLKDGPLPLRLSRPKSPIIIETNYHLSADQKAAAEVGSIVLTGV